MTHKLAPLILFLCAFSVHDGDSFTMDNGQKVRLFGIDAAEMANGHAQCPEQLCIQSNGMKYRCAAKARDYLVSLIDGKNVVCKAKGQSYDRMVGDCYVGKLSINEEMVKAGWAIELKRYSKKRFETAENKAKLSQSGIWQGEFETPAKYRNKCRDILTTR